MTVSKDKRHLPAQPAHDTAAAAQSPRIYYLHPRLIQNDWVTHVDHAAALGFTHVLLAWPFSATYDLFLTRDLDRIGNSGAEAELRAFIAACRAAGMAPWIDLAIGYAEAGGPLTTALPGGWLEVRRSVLDPRQNLNRNVVAAAFGNFEARGQLIRFWGERVLQWHGLGIRGLRCHAAGSTGLDVWRDILAPVRNADPMFKVLGWLPEAMRAERGQAGEVFDFVPSSVCWWDGEPWLAEEYNELAPTVGLLGFPEDPFAERRPSRSLASPAQRAEAAVSAAALLTDGWLMPMGFEFGMETPFLTAESEDFEAARQGSKDLRGAVRAANQAAGTLAGGQSGTIRPLQLGAGLNQFLRATPSSLHLVLLNRDLVDDAAADTVLIAARFGAVPACASPCTLPPATGTVVPLSDSAPVLSGAPDAPSDRIALAADRIAIEAVSPTVDDGRFPIKRSVGEEVEVSADIFGDGHEVLAAEVLWRAADEEIWNRTPMHPLGNDRWTGSFPLHRIGRHVFAIEAWWSEFGTYRRDLIKKRDAGLDVALEIIEGRLILEKFAANADAEARAVIADHLARLSASQPESTAVLLSTPLAAAMALADPRPHVTGAEQAFPIEADREAGCFASWYELFPRSITDSPARHGTFRDVLGRLPAIKAMGFDVLYFPPIHPIGRTNRKGRNNTLTPGPDDPGSPYAIGSADGGHDAIHPELGSRDDFRLLVREAARHGLEIALDFAIQCSPDHPWLRDHPGWFQWRPDGSMKYAENPPKKYQDIVNVDFYAEDAVPDLWLALRDVVQGWVDEGVRTFRVDNPHTKPFPFWEWLIADIRSRDPGVLFLAEAFTRPKVMYRLGKVGFSQSYTYFTWRNTKAELTEYLTELNAAPARDIYRPHFFVNTPDINPVFLQESGRPGFLIRAALAATLSGLWGVYSGFELCEAAPVPGKEEYLDSEKYEIKPRDWTAPGNIIAEITRLNQIRRAHPALQSHLGLAFYEASNDNILYFGKRAGPRSEIILVAVNLDPHAAHDASIEVPLWEFGLPDQGEIAVEDLMRGHRFTWHGKMQAIHLDPRELPFSIWRLAPVAEVRS